MNKSRLMMRRDHTLKLIDIHTFEVVANLHAPAFKVTSTHHNSSLT